MVQCLKLRLYGPPASIANAKALLENQPQVKELRQDDVEGALLLTLSSRLPEDDLVVLLAQSGVCGFKLIKQPDHQSHYISSRNGLPSSL